ncbi:MAG: hypothetical protein IT384_10500 [Deltaproteobacteria bacterium]|nr:hypothetical protein [Deltaproteobacteria bacterium]
MKGAGSVREGSVLQRVFMALGYVNDMKAKSARVFAYEWNQRDVIAARLPDAEQCWAEACWNGVWTYDVVCEVENNLAEFAMTMRTMFDVRARLSVGIFFATEVDPVVRCGRSDERKVSSYSPPTGGSAVFPFAFCGGDEVLILVLNEKRPELLGVQHHLCAPDGTWTRQSVEASEPRA